MSLYWITGGSGTGKSTVITELKRRGYEAYDVDEAGPVTAKWHNKHTGYVHPKSSVKPEHRTPEFLETHDWRVSRKDVELLHKQAGSRTAFIGGAIDNKNELNYLFDRTFALVINNKSLKQRLQNRMNNNWGKSPHELQLALDWNKDAIASHKKKGHIIIDASRPLGKVVDEILSYVNDR